MSVAQQQLAGAPGNLTLGGKSYAIAQPTPEDMGTIGAYLQRFAKSPVQALQDDPDFQFLDPEEQAALRKEKARAKFKSGVPYDPDDFMRVLTRVECVRFMFWLLARKGQPGLTLEDTHALITDANAAEIFVELDIATTMASLGNVAGRPGSGDGASPTNGK